MPGTCRRATAGKPPWREHGAADAFFERFLVACEPIVRVGTLALVTIALSRHFGPQSFGALAVGLALVRIFAVIGTFGLDRVVVRRVAENEGEARQFFGRRFASSC